MNRISGPQILVTVASEERNDTNNKIKLKKIFDWICKFHKFLLFYLIQIFFLPLQWKVLFFTLVLIWASALTRTCLEKAIFIGSVSSIVTIILFIAIYKVGKWRFNANKELEQTKVIFNFDKLLPKKRNSVQSISSIGN